MASSMATSTKTCENCGYPLVQGTFCPLCHSLGSWYWFEMLISTGLLVILGLFGWLVFILLYQPSKPDPLPVSSVATSTSTVEATVPATETPTSTTQSPSATDTAPPPSPSATETSIPEPPATPTPSLTATPLVIDPATPTLADTETPFDPVTATDTTTPTPTPTPFVSFDRGKVELRSGPAQIYPVISILGDSTIPFSVVGRNMDGDWLLICCVGQSPLWVAAEQVTVHNDVSTLAVATAPPAPAPTNTDTPTLTSTPTVTPIPTDTPIPTATAFVSVASGLVDLRNGPGTLYPVVAQFGPGFPFVVVGRDVTSTWLQICCMNEQRLWVEASQVTVHNDISAVGEATAPPPPATATPRTTPTATRTVTPIPTHTRTPTPVSSNLAPLAEIIASSYAEEGKDTCKPPNTTNFHPSNLSDGELTTAWRVEGDPTQDYVLFTFARPAIVQRIAIVPGYAKSDACTPSLNWCTINQVPKTIRLTFDDGSYEILNLERRCSWQYVSFVSVETQTIRLTILDTYPASDPKVQRDFTPISEIQVFGYLR